MFFFVVLFGCIWKLTLCWSLLLMIHGPLVPEEFIPKKYMKFDDLNDAYHYYCGYSKMVGFDVQKGRKGPQV
jgi:hypothetical protein